jgi:hypothetical protein
VVHVTTPRPPVQLHLLGGESELEERDCLQLVRPCEAPGVDRVDATGRDQIRQWRLGRGVVTGDEHRRLRPGVLGRKIGEGGVLNA